MCVADVASSGREESRVPALPSMRITPHGFISSDTDCRRPSASVPVNVVARTCAASWSGVSRTRLTEAVLDWELPAGPPALRRMSPIARMWPSRYSEAPPHSPSRKLSSKVISGFTSERAETPPRVVEVHRRPVEKPDRRQRGGELPTDREPERRSHRIVDERGLIDSRDVGAGGGERGRGRHCALCASVNREPDR